MKQTKWCWHNISDEKESLLMLTINVEEPLINSVASEAVDIDHRLVEFHHRINQRDLVISDIAKRTYSELINNDPFRKISVDILKQELTVHLVRRNTVYVTKKEDCEKGLSKEKLYIVNAYIESYYFRDIALKDLANSVNMSEYHFLRQYKKATHITPYQYIIN